MNIFLKALGCRLNEAELEQWACAFQTKGHVIVEDSEDADIIILNSCAVTKDAGKKSRQLLNRLYRQNPEAKLVITGCYASIEKDQVGEMLGVDLIVDNAQKDILPTLVMETFAIKTMPLVSMEPGESTMFLRGRHRAFIKVQDGCRYRCTYCIVTIARGEERSRSLEDISKEVNLHDSQGIQEVVLTGVHVGGYGSDLGLSLYDLVVHLLRETDIPRIRFASVEPWDLPEHFFSLFENSRVMPHMHLPIQSGVDSVLRRMSRRCKTAEFKALVEHARDVDPRFNITTDLITGFPGETEEEWRQTVDFVESVGFGHMHVFSFSPREGTKAAKLENVVAPDVKKQRTKEMIALAEKMKAQFYRDQMNTHSQVLWERAKKDEQGNTLYQGYTHNYLKIQTVSERPLENIIVDTHLSSYDKEQQLMLGSIV
ncbi:MAG: tRNA-t(6)A37 methylthiotransferase [uncultured Thiotrichaceae bacterium]|uniref:tRNA-t(6)A37 methylthiotransferase n=1 Tax=uncultured Thiotrichaceae bacterium TaxID=298394 RepID=A0A6S6U9P2_9GAMM|nr:MAG: tRNA-t(6)A37 methylthiotransferase [uncultured Thiotrichaceae bacterium]